jgi:hypothetical protein
MKTIYKSTKVIYDAHLKEYQVYYKIWIFWKYDRSYKFDEKVSAHPTHYCTKEQAEQRAIDRAKSMLETVEIWKQSNYLY